MEAVAPIEQPVVEAETANITPNEVIVEAEPEQPAKVALQDFEVIPEAAAVETTLEKVMEPLNEPVVEPVRVEEATVPAHPLEAPQGAQTEAEQSSEEAAAAAETEDSNEEETE